MSCILKTPLIFRGELAVELLRESKIYSLDSTNIAGVSPFGCDPGPHLYRSLILGFPVTTACHIQHGMNFTSCLVGILIRAYEIIPTELGSC